MTAYIPGIGAPWKTAFRTKTAATNQLQTAGREVRAAWRRTEAALAEAVRARRATERSKLELVEALIAERAGRVVLAQEVRAGVVRRLRELLAHSRCSGLWER